MLPDKEQHDLLQGIIDTSLQVFEHFKNKAFGMPMLLDKTLDMTTDLQSLLDTFLNNPLQLWQMQVNYWQDTLLLANEQLNHWLQGEMMPINDKRFQDDAWQSNPFFNAMSHYYLLASAHLNQLLLHMDYRDEQTAKRVRFFTKQYLDALSPSNFLGFNPTLLAETMQTRGTNLLKGLKNLLDDLKTGEASQFMISMTPRGAFEVGQNLACTKGRVIAQNDLMELIQYEASTEKVFARPLLLIPPWINKYYILDLSRHNSLIQWLVDQGITVFVISWANPDASFAHKGLFEYLEQGPQAAISIIQQQLGVSQVNTLGFCIGGTLQACLLAYQQALGLEPIHSATFLASLIDFSEPGDLGVYIDEQQIANIEKTMRELGYLDGRFIASAFNSLRANDLIWSFFIRNYLQGKEPVPFDMLHWNADLTNMPLTMQSQYLRWMYLHNDLIKPGKIRLNGQPLDVSAIEVPCFFVSTEKDHIAPWKTTYTGFQAIKGRKRFLLAKSGHIAGIINPPSQEKYGYFLNTGSPNKPEDWLAGACLQAGSWWPEWFKWLKKQSGSLIQSKPFDTLPLQGLRAAPGEYVHQQADLRKS